MCGRYDYVPWELRDIRIRFNIENEFTPFPASYNVAPDQNVPVVVHQNGANRLGMMRWGLVPTWAKDESMGYKMINARAETLMQRSSWKKLVGTRRCLLLAHGFYEWQRKVPTRFVLEPFTFAGLWDTWKKPDGNILHSCTIVTTEPNDLLRSVHDRMPVILCREAEPVWLDPTINEPGKVLPLLKPHPAEFMEGYEVSTLVNSPVNNNPECIQPVSSSRPKRVNS